MSYFENEQQTDIQYTGHQKVGRDRYVAFQLQNLLDAGCRSFVGGFGTGKTDTELIIAKPHT